MSQPYQPCEICIDEQCHEMLKTLEFYVLKLSDKQKCLILCENVQQPILRKGFKLAKKDLTFVRSFFKVLVRPQTFALEDFPADPFHFVVNLLPLDPPVYFFRLFLLLLPPCEWFLPEGL